MKKTAILLLAAAVLLSITASAQDEPKNNPYPENVQRDKAMKMKDLLFLIQRCLTDAEEEEALKNYQKLEKLYSDVKAGRITKRSYKQQMIEVWDLAQEKLYPVIRKIELKKSNKKAQEKPKEKAYPETKQHQRMLEMQEVLCKIYQHLADGKDSKALEAYDKLKEIYRDIELGRITDKKCKEKMFDTWRITQEKVVPRLPEKPAEKPQEKAEEKPADKPEEKAEKPESEPEEKKEETKKQEGSEYYPLETGMCWTYKSSNGAEALVNVSRTEKLNGKDCFVVEVLSGQKVQQRQWLHVTDDGIYTLKDYIRKPKKTVEYKTPFPIAKFPFKKGEKWTWLGSESGRKVSCTFEIKGEKTVAVPAGTFTGLEVVTLRNIGGYVQQVSEVFAPGVGLVYQEREVLGRKEKRILELTKYTKPEEKKTEKAQDKKKDEKEETDK